jgi:DNA-binding transcriptional MerR regulator
MQNGMLQFRIGELAAMLDLNPKTIRYYEDIKLLPEPSRTAAGYRMYGRDDHERLEFIAKAKQIGFTLDEIKSVLELKNDGKCPCDHVHSLIDQKLRSIEEQLQTLCAVQHDLLTIRSEAEANPGLSSQVCSIIERHDTPL